MSTTILEAKPAKAKKTLQEAYRASDPETSAKIWLAFNIAHQTASLVARRTRRTVEDSKGLEKAVETREAASKAFHDALASEDSTKAAIVVNYKAMESAEDKILGIKHDASEDEVVKGKAEEAKEIGDARKLAYTQFLGNFAVKYGEILTMQGELETLRKPPAPAVVNVVMK